MAHEHEGDALDAPIAVPLAGTVGRRRFLALAGATAGAAAATAWLRPSLLFGDPAGASPATGNVVVHVFLRGGADGLSIAAPVGDGTYQARRPGIAIPEAAALPLAAGFGLHPAATRLKALYDQGRLAVVPAAGSPNPSRSHFEAQDLIEKGTPSTPSTVDGWLGRWVNGTANAQESSLRGVGVGYGLQASLRGSPAVSTPDLASLALDDYGTLTWGDTGPEMARALNGMYAGVADPLLRSQAGAALDVVNQLSPIVADGEMPEDWPDHFGGALWPIARLLAGGIPVEVATADLGGWDLHDQMGAATNVYGAQHGLVAELDAALGAFFAYLGPIGDRVTVVVMTEFGRTIAVNGSGGTDHGRGQTMLVVGGGVSGGVKGAWPGLVDTDNGDVRVVNDYRTILCEVLAERMRAADLSAVFPGFATTAGWLGVTDPTAPGGTMAAQGYVAESFGARSGVPTVPAPAPEGSRLANAEPLAPPAPAGLPRF